MIALTGGAGFIGSCFLKKLNDEGVFDVLVVDVLGTGEKWKNLLGKRFLGIVSPDAFLDGLADGDYDGGLDAVVHFGACTSTTERDADFLLKNNVEYSRAIACYCMDNAVRLVYASSAATYGLGEQGCSDDLLHSLLPLNMYGYSKQLFDVWASDNDILDSAAGIKFFNVFGPNEYHKADMASMIFKAYRQIKETGRVQLFRSTSPEYSDGGQMRDFVYVKDCCEAMWHLLNNTRVNGIFNLGSGIPRSWNDLASAVFSSMNVGTNIEYTDMPESLRGQYQNYTMADMKKLRSAIPDIPQFQTLESSIDDYVQNYLLQGQKHY